MPRTPEQYEEIRNEKKRVIMNAALELFANEGFHATSISKIAEKANISKGLMYNYFSSKEELLAEIINAGFHEFIDLFDQNKDGILTDEEFVFFINTLFVVLHENVSYWRLFYSLLLQPSVFQLMGPKINEWYVPLIQSLEKYFQDKSFENPKVEALMFGSLLDGIGFHYVMNPEIYPVKEVKQHLIKKYITG